MSIPGCGGGMAVAWCFNVPGKAALHCLWQQGFDRADEIPQKADERIEPPKPDLIHRKAGVRAGPQIPFRVWMICGLAVPTLLNCFDSRE